MHCGATGPSAAPRSPNFEAESGVGKLPATSLSEYKSVKTVSKNKRTTRRKIVTTNTGVSQPMIGDPAPLFDMVDPKGNQFSLADQRGKIIVVHFGTTW